MKNNALFNLILYFSIFKLFSAYFIEYILGHQPCNLCLMERVPYFLAIVIIIISILFRKYVKIFTTLLILTFISATLLSFYHLSIEQGFIKESLVCDLKSLNNLTAEDILKELKEKTISCKIVTFRIFGLSLATINTMISLILSIMLIKKILKHE